MELAVISLGSFSLQLILVSFLWPQQQSARSCELSIEMCTLSPDALCLGGSQCHRLRKQWWFSFMNIEEESSSVLKCQRFAQCVYSVVCVSTHSVSICSMSEYPLSLIKTNFLKPCFAEGIISKKKPQKPSSCPCYVACSEGAEKWKVVFLNRLIGGLGQVVQL